RPQPREAPRPHASGLDVPHHRVLGLDLVSEVGLDLLAREGGGEEHARLAAPGPAGAGQAVEVGDGEVGGVGEGVVVGEAGGAAVAEAEAAGGAALGDAVGVGEGEEDAGLVEVGGGRVRVGGFPSIPSALSIRSIPQAPAPVPRLLPDAGVGATVLL